MPRQRSPKRDEAVKLWLNSGKKMLLKDIAKELNVSESQIRKWKNIDQWEKVTLLNRNGNVTIQRKKNKGGQPGNRNATGPPGNQNARKHGFYSRYIPKETLEIMDHMSEDPLDVLWMQIQIAYAAIIRSQKIMHVEDKEDKTIERVGEKRGKVSGEEWEVQQAWDKQANFLKAQSRAQGELRNMIRQYEEMVNKNWKLVTVEQIARIKYIKAHTEKVMDGEQAAIEDKVQSCLKQLGVR